MCMVKFIPASFVVIVLQAKQRTYMVKKYQDVHSIIKCRWLSSIRVHSTYSCEVIISRISKPFFACGRSRTSHRSHKKKNLMRMVRSSLSTRRKKRFGKITFIGLTRVSIVNTNWGKSPALYNGVLLLVNISHICGLHNFLRAPLSFNLFICEFVSMFIYSFGYVWICTNG